MPTITIIKIRTIMDWSTLKRETYFDYHVSIPRDNGRTEIAGTAKEGEIINLDDEHEA